MLIRIITAVLIGVIAWILAGLVTDDRKAALVGVLVGVVAFLVGVSVT